MKEYIHGYDYEIKWKNGTEFFFTGNMVSPNYELEEFFAVAFQDIEEDTILFDFTKLGHVNTRAVVDLHHVIARLEKGKKIVFRIDKKNESHSHIIEGFQIICPGKVEITKDSLYKEGSKPDV